MGRGKKKARKGSAQPEEKGPPELPKMELEEDDEEEDGDDEGNGMEMKEEEEEEEDLEDEDEEDEGSDDYDDGEGGEEEAGDGQAVSMNQAVSKPSRKAEGRFTLPTKEEMSHLRETENLFRSNLLRLQMKELLAEVKAPVNTKATKALEKFLFSLRELLLKLPDKDLGSNAVVPGVRLTKHWQARRFQEAEPFRFATPTSVDVVGSFLLGTLCKPDLCVDLSVEMPARLFDPKDFLNHRYFDKRNAYLSHLARELSSPSKSALIARVHLTYFKSDPRKPILVLQPAASATFSVRLLPTVAPGTISPSKLEPSRNNVRREFHKDQGPEPATPGYNNALAQELGFRAHLAALHQGLHQAPGLVDAIVLLKVWLFQRELHLSPDSLDGFIVSMIVLGLLNNKRLNTRMEALPALMVVFKYLSETDLNKQPLVIPSSTPLTDLEPSSATPHLGISRYQSHYDVCVLDPALAINIAGRMTAGAMEEIRREAATSLRLLQDHAHDAFSQLFLTRVPFLRGYDYYIEVPLPKSGPTPGPEVTPEEEAALCDMMVDTYLTRRVTGLTEKALGNRARRVRGVCRSVLPPEPGRLFPRQEWSAHDPAPLCGSSSLWVGIKANPEHALRLVDRGPPAEETEAALEFRRFWGSKAELRRFRDGSIVEAVVWGNGPADRERILEKIVRHVLQIHEPQRLGHGSGGDGVRVLGNELLELVGLGASVDPDSATREAVHAADRVTQKLKALEILPLRIESVNAVSPYLRYTSLFPPLPHPLAHGAGRLTKELEGKAVTSFIDPIMLQVRLEPSPQWPKEVEAIRAAKTAFLIQMAKGLSGDADLKAQASRDHLDLFHQGYGFRVVIMVPQELHLLRRQQYPGIVVGTGDTDPPEGPQVQVLKGEAGQLEVQHHSAYVHHSIIRSCHLQQPLLGPVVRAAHVWLQNHRLGGGHLPFEAVELLVASLMGKQSNPFEGPASVLRGFLSFLSLVATTDWETTPLVVDPQEQLKASDYDDIHSAMEKARGPRGKEGPALYVVGPYDRNRGWLPSWTMDKPERVVLKRLAGLAQRSLKQMLGWAAGSEGAPGGQGWRRTFLPPPVGPQTANVVLRVSPDLAGPLSSPFLHGRQALDQYRLGPKALRAGKMYKNLATAGKEKLLMGFGPVLDLVRLLESTFGNLALFFIDELQQDAIYLVWRPQAFLPTTNFQVLCSHNKMLIRPLEEDHGAIAKPLVLPNIAELLHELRQVSEGMVHEVVVL